MDKIQHYDNTVIVSVYYALINACYVLLLLWTVPMYTMLSIKKNFIRTHDENERQQKFMF